MKKINPFNIEKEINDWDHALGSLVNHIKK